MTLEELDELFEKHADEYLNKGEIKGPKDLAAFNRLHELVPSDKDIVSASEHDEYWLSIEPEDFAAAATEEDVIFLCRCGVMYADGMGFSLFA